MIEYHSLNSKSSCQPKLPGDRGGRALSKFQDLCTRSVKPAGSMERLNYVFSVNLSLVTVCLMVLTVVFMKVTILSSGRACTVV
jgi:hypothetical protein